MSPHTSGSALETVPTSIAWSRPLALRDGETPEDLAMLVYWVASDCPALEGETLTLARRFDWTSRAKAIHALANPKPVDPQTAIRETCEGLISLAHKSTQRALANEKDISIRDTVLVLSFLRGDQVAGPTSRVDLTALDDADLEALERIQRKATGQHPAGGDRAPHAPLTRAPDPAENGGAD